jgi:thiol-disulfide isomerase/thioredoxin
MKKQILILTLLISVFTLNAQSDSSPVITGVFSDSIMGTDFFKEWLMIQGDPMPDAGSVSKLKAIPTKTFSFRIFMGTWCEDSQLHVPRFVKIANELNWKYSLIGVNREKECPFEKKDCKAWDIQFVPTIVVYRDDIEVGRIVENPKKSIEDDLLDIITKGLN